MEELMEKVIELIERDNLKSKSRAHEKVSKRFYLYHILRRNGMTLNLISKLFEKNHASVIHGIKVYKNRVEINDHAMVHHLVEYRRIIEGIEVRYHNLKQDIKSATTIKDLNIIKKRAELNLYPQLYY